MKTIAVANQKGGVGKSTVSVHLAFYASELGARVLFVDTDAQANSTTTLSDHASTLSATSLFKPDKVALPSPTGPGITLISADSGLSDTDRLPFAVIGNFVNNLKALAPKFDLCVIDTPPAAGLRQLAALIASEFVVSPIELANYSIDGIESMMKTIVGVQREYNPKLSFIGMLPNRFNSHSPGQKAALLDLAAHHAKRVVPVAIGLRTSIEEAVSEKIPVWRMTKSSAREAGKEMKRALEHIAKQMGGITNGT